VGILNIEIVLVSTTVLQYSWCCHSWGS